MDSKKFWYSIFGISFLSIISWIIVGTQSTEDKDFLTKEIKSAKTYINPEIKIEVFEELARREILTNVSFKDLKDYQEINTLNSESKNITPKQVKTTIDNPEIINNNDNDIGASSSASLN